ncbi:MAG: hypothetical protein MMC33_007331 [Icmadophila ericetorum]|nr:hypothetical protein [Icmadophila ericetorum]
MNRPTVVDYGPSLGQTTTASINFEEFSFLDNATGVMHETSSENQSALGYYMEETHGVTTTDICIPFLILYYKDEIPEWESRPLLIAGCVGVWQVEGTAFPVHLFPGNLGGGEDLKIDDTLVIDLESANPRTATLFKLVTDYFPFAIAISNLNGGLVIELPETDRSIYGETIALLPSNIVSCGMPLGYNNGELAKTELKRLKQPLPKLIDGAYDDVDKLANGGQFFSGVMLSSTSGTSISAGIELRRGFENRLSIAFHNWDDKYVKNNDNLGDPGYFHIFQEDIKTGTHIRPSSPFENSFLELNAAARALLSSDQVCSGDLFCVDSFVTGLQKLRCLGKRVRVRTDSREKDLTGAKGQLPGPGTNVLLVQGIYATDAPEITGKPQIRASVCGSALVRVGKGIAGDVSHLGEFGGLLRWSDLRGKNLATDLLCYAEALDPLIHAGWGVASASKSLPVALKLVVISPESKLLPLAYIC